MGTTKIEWCDKTWSPITGCSPISEGCANCYAKRMAQRLRGRYGYPKDKPFVPVFHPKRLEEPFHWKKPRRIFVCSMGDLFHDFISDFTRMAVMNTVWGCQQHRFIILTKRPSIMRDFFERQPVPENLWIGVSVENQQWADERIPVLLQIPAKIRFVSIEPMLGPVDLESYLNGMPESIGGGIHYVTRDMALDACMPEIEGMPIEEEPEWRQTVEPLNWVILGGESGPRARPMHPDWVRKVRDGCQAGGVPFFFKQWGEWVERKEDYWHFPWVMMVSDPQGIPQALDKSFIRMSRIGKKAAGRELDGRLWEEWPE